MMECVICRKNKTSAWVRLHRYREDVDVCKGCTESISTAVTTGNWHGRLDEVGK